MAKLYNRAKMTTATTGTGTITLVAAVLGYQTFATSGVQNGDTVSYAIDDNSGAWEYGTGTYSTTGPTLTRTLGQSSTGSLLSLSGNSVVYIAPLAADIVSNGGNNTLGVANGGTGLTSLTAGYIPYASSSSAFSFSNLYSDGSNLGLGVTPSFRLQVAGDGANVLPTSCGQIVITGKTNTSQQMMLGYDTTNNYGYIQPTLVGTAYQNLVLCQGGGNVGIGTTSPGYKLDVQNGPARLGASGSQQQFFIYGNEYISNTNNWNYSDLNLIRTSSNTPSIRRLSFMLGGDNDSDTTVGGYNAIWSFYNATPTSASTSSALQGQMVYASYSGHQFYINGSQRVAIDSSGNVSLASGNLTLNNASAYFNTGNSSYFGVGSILVSGAASTDTGFLTAGNFVFGTNAGAGNTERVRITSSGNLLITGGGGLGYGTGSGGTVTQATNKATGVTLNKTVGKITTSNAALASNTTVTFTLTNSTIGVNDIIVISMDGNSTSNTSSYNIWAAAGSGAAYISIRNTGGVSLSDIIYINFAVIKGATS